MGVFKSVSKILIIEVLVLIPGASCLALVDLEMPTDDSNIVHSALDQLHSAEVSTSVEEMKDDLDGALEICTSGSEECMTVSGDDLDNFNNSNLPDTISIIPLRVSEDSVLYESLPQLSDSPATAPVDHLQMEISGTGTEFASTAFTPPVDIPKIEQVIAPSEPVNAIEQKVTVITNNPAQHLSEPIETKLSPILADTENPTVSTDDSETATPTNLPNTAEGNLSDGSANVLSFNENTSNNILLSNNFMYWVFSGILAYFSGVMMIMLLVCRNNRRSLQRQVKVRKKAFQYIKARR